MTSADLKHCEKLHDAIEDLNRYEAGGRIESGHSIKICEKMESKSHDFVAELRMHLLTADCYIF